MADGEVIDAPHIRSFVRRAPHMSSAQRHGLEIADRYLADGDSPTTDGFPAPRPTILDIGFGMGQATAQFAVRFPAYNVLGIEVHRPGIGSLCATLERERIENVRVIEGDAAVVLRNRIPPSSLAGIHVLFPDPWPKKRHQKRRFIQPTMVAAMADRLAVGGYLYIATDWEDYGRQILDVTSGCPWLVNPYGGFAPPQVWRTRTAFERKGLAAGRGILEVCCRKAWIERSGTA